MQAEHLAGRSEGSLTKNMCMSQEEPQLYQQVFSGVHDSPYTFIYDWYQAPLGVLRVYVGILSTAETEFSTILKRSISSRTSAVF